MQITRTCSRCRGTGNWAPGRVCFQCNGAGYLATDTKEAARNRKAAHVDEVKDIIAKNEALLLKARFGKSQIQKEIDNRKAQLIQLEAELSSMER